MIQKGIVLGLAAAALVLAGCASDKNLDPEAKDLDGTVKTEVLEHKGTALGINQLPVWVETYISEGIYGVEKLSSYEGSYCFIGEEAGSNLDALQTWVANYDVPSEISRNVSTRVNALFTGAASGSPDGEYGTYFENVVKTVSSADYSGARKVNDWWVLTRRYNPDQKKKYVDEYRCYVLYTIEKDLMDQQVLDMMDKAAAEAKETTDAQKSAISNVRSIMASEGF